MLSFIGASLESQIKQLGGNDMQDTGILKRLSIAGAGDRKIDWVDVVNYALSCKKGVVQKSSVAFTSGYTPDPNMRY